MTVYCHRGTRGRMQVRANGSTLDKDEPDWNKQLLSIGLLIAVGRVTDRQTDGRTADVRGSMAVSQSISMDSSMIPSCVARSQAVSLPVELFRLDKVYKHRVHLDRQTHAHFTDTNISHRHIKAAGKTVPCVQLFPPFGSATENNSEVI